MRRISPNKTPRRRGVSMIEMMLTVTIGGLVMGLGVGMLHLMLRTDHTLADSLHRRQVVAALSKSFRNDVHAATSARLGEGQATELILELGDQRVTYAVDENSLHRRASHGEEILQTEAFMFPDGITASFRVADSRQIVLEIRQTNPMTDSTKTSPRNTPQRVLKIQPILGKDLRFTQKHES